MGKASKRRNQAERRITVRAHRGCIVVLGHVIRPRHTMLMWIFLDRPDARRRFIPTKADPVLDTERQEILAAVVRHWGLSPQETDDLRAALDAVGDDVKVQRSAWQSACRSATDGRRTAVTPTRRGSDRRFE